MATNTMQRQPDIFFIIIAYIFMGFIFWFTARWLASTIQPFTQNMPALAGTAMKAAIEELLRISVSILALSCINWFGWNKKTFLFSIVASVTFAVLENANYLLAFPSSDIYLRAGYSSLIHANNAAIMALAGIASIGKKNKTLMFNLISFTFCLALHFAFNAVAASRYINAFTLPGIIVNCIFLLAIFFCSELILFYKEEIDERH